MNAPLPPPSILPTIMPGPSDSWSPAVHIPSALGSGSGGASPSLGWMPWLPSSDFAPAHPVHQPAHLFVPQGSAAPTPGSSPP